MRACVLAGVAVSALCCSVARAQDADPPGRLARLSDAEGSVSLQPAGVEDWTAGQINRPLTSGDRLWSDQDSRAELDLGGAIIRLASSTAFSFFNLDERSAQMQLTAGELIVRVGDMAANQLYEVDTPNVVVTLLAPGEYRVEVSAAGDATVLKVSAGSARAEGGGLSVPVGTQQMARLLGAQVQNYEIAALGSPDDFDAWSAARDAYLMQSASGQYVPPDTPGTADLDANGTWQLTPDYGYVWAPTVIDLGWAPYRFGHWAWIAPWGWTWVDDSPWGYAPYHYGRWVLWNSAWCWVPGPRHSRPVYAPALVGWVGGPGRAGPAALAGQVGWFPLGPHEVYVPPYAVSAGYLRHVNLAGTTLSSSVAAGLSRGSTTNLDYVNHTAAGVTAVAQGAFAAGDGLRGHTVAVSAAVLAATSALAVAPPIAPSRQSVLGPTPKRLVLRPPAAYLTRPVLVRTPPPRAPATFERQLAAIQANGGQALSRGELAPLQSPAAAAPLRMLPNAAPARAAVAAGQAPSESVVDFAAREHALENSTLPSMPRQNIYQPPPTAADTALPGTAAPRTPAATHSDRPPGASSPATGAPGTASAPSRAAPAPSAYYHPSTHTPASAAHAASPPPAHHAAPPADAVHASSVSSHDSGGHVEERPAH